jgi:hypothetical protein
VTHDYRFTARPISRQPRADCCSHAPGSWPTSLTPKSARSWCSCAGKGGQHLESPPRRGAQVAELVPRTRVKRFDRSRVGRAVHPARLRYPGPVPHRHRPAHCPPRHPHRRESVVADPALVCQVRAGYAYRLRRCRERPAQKWHLDEVFMTINGRRQCLWRAVDRYGNVVDILVQCRRDASGSSAHSSRGGARLLGCRSVTSSAVAHREVVPSVETGNRDT